MASARLLVSLFMLLGCLSPVCLGGKVMISMLASKSHVIQGVEIGKSLQELGHEITFTATKPFCCEALILDAGMNVLYFRTPDSFDAFGGDEFLKWLGKTIFTRDAKTFATEVGNNVMNVCSYMMEDKDFLREVEAEKFDIVLYDGFPLTECLVILPHYLGLQHVFLFSNHPLTQPIYKLTPAFKPSLFSLTTHEMTCFERLQNLLFSALEYSGGLGAQRNTTLLKKYGHGVSCWSEVTSKSLLYLITTDHLLDWPTPTFPNMIHTPGITTKPARPLPECLETLLASSSTDVVLVSFGTVINLAYTPRYIIENILEALRRVPEFLFLMKVDLDEEASSFRIPDNVKTFHWLPQNDILGHAKTRVFISHGGMNSVHEAAYHGVPVVALPAFGDQPKNAFNMQAHGLGKTLDLMNFTPQELADTIRQVSNPENTYIETNNKMSAIFKSFNTRPRDTMAFWVDHVMRFGGDHLKSSAQDMSILTLYMVDIAAFLVAIVISVCTVVYCVCKKCIRMKTGKSKKE